jgi:hypothetical protein
MASEVNALPLTCFVQMMHSAVMETIIGHAGRDRPDPGHGIGDRLGFLWLGGVPNARPIIRFLEPPDSVPYRQ